MSNVVIPTVPVPVGPAREVSREAVQKAIDVIVRLGNGLSTIITNDIAKAWIAGFVRVASQPFVVDVVVFASKKPVWPLDKSWVLEALTTLVKTVDGVAVVFPKPWLQLIANVLNQFGNQPWVADIILALINLMTDGDTVRFDAAVSAAQRQLQLHTGS